MNSSPASIELLAHFDAVHDRLENDVAPPRRGVRWVLTWAVATVVIVVAASFLLRFGCCVVAEHALARAARAGAQEATLPGATRHSVAAAIERRAAAYSITADQHELRVSMLQNGMPARHTLVLSPGDRLAVVVSLPVEAVLPTWLTAMSMPAGNSRIEARAESRMPGKQLSN